MPESHLARNSFVTAQSMADMVTSLRARGLIDRHRDPADRRRLVLFLTKDGLRLLDRYRPAVVDLESEMLSGLSADQAIDLRAVLLSCRAALNCTLNP